MKIAHVSATFPPYMAGSGNVCYQYCRELAKLGHEITVYTSRYPDIDYTYPSEIRVNRYKPFIRLGNAPFIINLLKIRNHDIIHLHYPFIFGGELILLLKIMTGQKYIVTYHNDLIGTGLKSILFKLYQNTFGTLILLNASKILLMTRNYIEISEMKDIFYKKQNSIIILPNGVDINRFSPNKGINDNSNKKQGIIIFVGALDKAHSYKGLEFLMNACSKILGNSKKFYLLIIGDGELMNYYQNYAHSLGIQEICHFLGKIDNDKISDYYNKSDFLVHPSTNENFPLVILEAMATGKAVISTNLPGLNLIVDDDQTGFLVEPKDVDTLALKIKYLLEENEVCEEFGRQARKKILDNYSWEMIIKKLELIYEEII